MGAHGLQPEVEFSNVLAVQINRGKNQVLVGTIPFCGEYLVPRFEDKFRSANQMNGISKACGDKMARQLICKQDNMRSTV